MYSDCQVDDILDGFVIVEAPREVPGEWSRLVNVAAYLSENLSSTASDIDPRACEQCRDSITEMMKETMKEAEEESEKYKTYLEAIEAESCEEDLEALQQQLSALLLEEEKLMMELSVANEEEKQVALSMEEQMTEKNKIDIEEERVTKLGLKCIHGFHLCEEELITLRCQLEYVKRKTELFKRIDVFTTTFHIWHRQDFGTINDLRLGYLPSDPVDWSEINAAWGQSALLLAAVFKKLGCEFSKFRIVPFGSRSYIETIEEKKILPLFGSGSFKYYWDNRLDTAMVAFLECVKQLKNSPKGRTLICFPYDIENTRLKDPTTGRSFSIRMRWNCEVHWTKCLKFLLTNLKWALISLPISDKEVEERCKNKRIRSISNRK